MIFYFYLWWPFCSAERNDFSNFGGGSPKKHFCEISLKSGHWAGRWRRLKVFFSILAASSAEQKGLSSNFARGPPKERCCEIILKSVQLFWSSRLKEMLTTDALTDDGKRPVTIPLHEHWGELNIETGNVRTHNSQNHSSVEHTVFKIVLHFVS